MIGPMISQQANQIWSCGHQACEISTQRPYHSHHTLQTALLLAVVTEVTMMADGDLECLVTFPVLPTPAFITQIAQFLHGCEMPPSLPPYSSFSLPPPLPPPPTHTPV